MSWRDLVAPFRERVEKAVAENPNLSGIYQFVIMGEEGAAFYANFHDGQVELVEGRHENAAVTIEAALETVQSLVAKKLNPMMAFMSGKLKVKGDMSLVMKMHSVLLG